MQFETEIREEKIENIEKQITKFETRINEIKADIEKEIKSSREENLKHVRIPDIYERKELEEKMELKKNSNRYKTK